GARAAQGRVRGGPAQGRGAQALPRERPDRGGAPAHRERAHQDPEREGRRAGTRRLGDSRAAGQRQEGRGLEGSAETLRLPARGPALLVSVAAGARSRLAFALDYGSLDDARRGAERVAESVGVLKVGLELFVREGPRAVAIGRKLDRDVFLDLKLHDIPETVERAVASAASLGVRYLTLHAGGGPRMLEAAARRVERERADLVLLAVTVLTSLDAADLSAVGVTASPLEQAERLADLAAKSGVPGLVCSAAEVAALRARL